MNKIKPIWAILPKLFYPNGFSKIHKSKRIKISFLFLLQTISFYSSYESLKFTSLFFGHPELWFGVGSGQECQNIYFGIVHLEANVSMWCDWAWERKLRPKTVVVSVVVDDVGKNLERSHWHEINVSILSFNCYLAHPSYLLLPP